MSGTPEPVPDPTAPPAPPADDLDALVERLSQFDPAEVTRRIEALESSSGGGVSQDALDSALEEIRNRLEELGEGLKSLLKPKRQPKDPPADPPADPPPAPPADPPTELHPPRGSMLAKLWDTPVIGKQSG